MKGYKNPAAAENKTSARESNVHKGHQAGSGKVSGIEKVGGKTGVRFPVHNHPEVCNVSSPEKK